jgi:hypothetical protein
MMDGQVDAVVGMLHVGDRGVLSGPAVEVLLRVLGLDNSTRVSQPFSITP